MTKDTKGKAPDSKLPGTASTDPVSVETPSTVSVCSPEGMEVTDDPPATLESSMTTVSITSPAAPENLEGTGELDSDTRETGGLPGIPVVKVSADDPCSSGASGFSGDTSQCEKKKRDPLGSPESHDSSLLKRRKCSKEKPFGLTVPEPVGLVPPEPVDPALRSPGRVLSNVKFTIPIENHGEYDFYGPRREFTVISLKSSEILHEEIDEKILPLNYLALANLPKESFLVTEYCSNFVNWNESLYMKHQTRYLFYISEEKKKIVSNAEDVKLPMDIENGLRRAVEDAVDKIKDHLVYRTRCEEENVFNKEFYCSYHKEDKYKPPFSNTEMFSRISTSESLLKLSILLLALADGSLNNTRLVAGIGYCYIAHQMVSKFRLLSVLDQPFYVLDHYIRQRVGAAIYALELYKEKDGIIDEKPYDEVCECFADITDAFFEECETRAEWKHFQLFPDQSLPRVEFKDFVDKLVKPRSRWAIDSLLTWTTKVTFTIRTVHHAGSILEDFQMHVKRQTLQTLVMGYLSMRDFEMDRDDCENQHLKALVARYRGLFFAPLLESFEDSTQADDFASRVAEDLDIAVDAERNSQVPNAAFFEKLLEERMVFTLFRLFYHTWEVQTQQDVTLIRRKLLGLRQAAKELRNTYGHSGKFSAIAALSSIVYLDYTCGMEGEASEMAIKQARITCHKIAGENLAGDQHCKDVCLTLLSLKMKEIHDYCIAEEEDHDDKLIYEICCRSLKISTLAYPVLSYYGGNPKVEPLNLPDLEIEETPCESYKFRTRKHRPDQNGQKLLYFNPPEGFKATIKAAKFLNVGINLKPVSEGKTCGEAAADEKGSCSEDDPKDPKEEEMENPSTDEEMGDSNLFVANLTRSILQDSPTFYSTFFSLPSRETMAAALEKFTRQSEAVSVMLEPLRQGMIRSSMPLTPRTSGSFDKVRIDNAMQKIKAFRPIDLESFYKEVSNENVGNSKTWDFESSRFEEVFNSPSPYVAKTSDDAEDLLMSSMLRTLDDILGSIQRSMSLCYGELDELKKKHWEKWDARILSLITRVKDRRLNRLNRLSLLELMHHFSVVLGHPTRIFVDPNSC